MDIDSTKLTVFFEAPFWIGVFERIERRKLSVCKVVFGAEPKDYEVWEYLLKNYSRLRFSPSVETVVKKESVNPKRLQRQIRKETAATGIGTKSQQALQMQREENKLVRKALSRKQREAEKQRQFELKQQKRKEKHRGRSCPFAFIWQGLGQARPNKKLSQRGRKFSRIENLWPRDDSCSHENPYFLKKRFSQPKEDAP